MTMKKKRWQMNLHFNQHTREIISPPEQTVDPALHLSRYQPAPDTIERAKKLTELSKTLKYGS